MNTLGRATGHRPLMTHQNYHWTMQALDAGGNVLGTGRVEAMFPP